MLRQVNSTVPICAEVYKSKGVYNPKRLFGVTTLDVVRASRFVSQIKNTDPADEQITVVGGHSGVTIVPLLSQNHGDITGQQLDDLVTRIQFGGDEVVKAKDGAGSATLSMAMAGARFAESILKASQGSKGVVEPTFVESNLYKDKGCSFFASPVELGPNGVEKVHGIGKVSQHEERLLEAVSRRLNPFIFYHFCIGGQPFAITALADTLGFSASPTSPRISRKVSSGSRPIHRFCTTPVSVNRKEPPWAQSYIRP